MLETIITTQLQFQAAVVISRKLAINFEGGSEFAFRAPKFLRMFKEVIDLRNNFIFLSTVKRKFICFKILLPLGFNNVLMYVTGISSFCRNISFIYYTYCT